MAASRNERSLNRRTIRFTSWCRRFGRTLGEVCSRDKTQGNMLLRVRRGIEVDREAGDLITLHRKDFRHVAREAWPAVGWLQLISCEATGLVTVDDQLAQLERDNHRVEAFGALDEGRAVIDLPIRAGEAGECNIVREETFPRTLGSQRLIVALNRCPGFHVAHPG